MEDLIISGYQNEFLVPTIELHAATGKCSITGEAYLENSKTFFDPIVRWLEEYMATEGPLDFTLNLSYFDTKSSGSLQRLVGMLKEYEQKGGAVTVRWLYEEDNFEMEEEIEDFIVSTGLDIQMVPYRG